LPEGFDAEYYPSPLPDLYVGDPVSISIRGQNSNGMATLNGKIGTQGWIVKVPLEQASEAVGIAKVWARDKIANLERSLIAQSGNNPIQESTDAELLRTALSYGMVSRLSSLVALDVTPSRPTTSRLIQSKLPTAIPHGWDKSQFEFKRQDVLPPKLQKIQAPTAKFYKASLDSQSTTYDLPQTAMNWRYKAFLALLSLLLGIALLCISRKPSHA
jgi:Ca-activated chloride channel family protein